MDRAHKRLRELHAVIEWLLGHWDHLPQRVYGARTVDDVVELVPLDIREHLIELVRQDFANAITPTVAWRQIMEVEMREEQEQADNE